MAHQVVQPLHEGPPAAKRQKLSSSAGGQSAKQGAGMPSMEAPVHYMELEKPHKDSSAGLFPDSPPVSGMGPGLQPKPDVPFSKVSTADLQPADSPAVIGNGNSTGTQLHSIQFMPHTAAESDPSDATGSADTMRSMRPSQPDAAGPSVTDFAHAASKGALPAENSITQHASAEAGIGTSDAVSPEDGLPDRVPGTDTAAAAADGMKLAEAEEEEVATGKVERAVRAVATATGCDICGEVMRDPVTAPECMHSFCAACIDEYIFDLQARTCPVCQLEGVSTNLGNMPYHHHRLQFDFTLADVIRKLFPRPEVERQIEERRRDERRFMEQAQRKGQQSEASTPASSPGASFPGFAPASADMITLLLLPAAAQQASSPLVSSAILDPPSAHGPSPPTSNNLADGPTPMDTSQSKQPSSISQSKAGPGSNAHTGAPVSEPSAGQNGAEPLDDHGLDRPYLRVEKGLSVSMLQQYVAARLMEQRAEHGQNGPAVSPPVNGFAAAGSRQSTTSLYLDAHRLPEESTLGALLHQQPGSQVLLLHYGQ